MRVTIVKDAHGVECVHRAGCADIKKRGNRVSEAWTADFATLEELYASYWDCIADESVPDPYPTLRHAYYAWQGEFNVLPCASGLEEMNDPDADPQPEGSKGEEKKMDAATYKTHRISVMRKPEEMAKCLAEHGVTEVPAQRQAQIKLHDSLCKADADAPETSQPTPDPEPAQPVPPRRGRKAAPKADAEPQPDAKPEPPELGIPYAPLTKQGRNTVATCPECGKTFVEKFGKDGEQTTQHYAEHYATAHKASEPQPEPQPEPAKRTRKAAPKPQEPAEPAKRSRKPAAKQEPAKPATRGRKPAASEPKPEANGTSTREHKQALARSLADLVAGHFAGANAADKAQLAYWLHSLPTGPQAEGAEGPHNRYFPKGLPRPQTADWQAR
jgi:hypothetical protein